MISSCSFKHRVLFLLHIACLSVSFLLLTTLFFSPFFWASQALFSPNRYAFTSAQICQWQFSIKAGHPDLKTRFQILRLGRKPGDWSSVPENMVLTPKWLNSRTWKVFSIADARGISMLIILGIEISYLRVKGITFDLAICPSFLN